MKIARGDIADRFDGIHDTYIEVAKETKNQILREGKILDAYRDYRGAYKQAQVLAIEVLEKATAKLDAAKATLAQASRGGGEFRRHRAGQARRTRIRPRREAARDDG